MTQVYPNRYRLSTHNSQTSHTAYIALRHGGLGGLAALRPRGQGGHLAPSVTAVDGDVDGEGRLTVHRKRRFR